MRKVSEEQITLSYTSMLLEKLYKSRLEHEVISLSPQIPQLYEVNILLEDYEVFRVYPDSNEDIDRTIYMLPLL